MLDRVADIGQNPTEKEEAVSDTIAVLKDAVSSPDDVEWQAIRDHLRKENATKMSRIREAYQAGEISRRDFIKLLGVGVGLATTASTGAAGWTKVQPENQGTSGIDADTIDGAHASELGRVTDRDRNGSVQFSTLPVATTNTTNGGAATGTISTKISTSTRVNVDEMTGYISGGKGTMTLSRGGSSVTGASLGNKSSLTATGSPGTSPVTWTLRMDVTALDYTTNTSSIQSDTFSTIGTSGAATGDVGQISFTNTSGGYIYANCSITNVTSNGQTMSGTLKILTSVSSNAKTVASVQSTDFNAYPTFTGRTSYVLTTNETCKPGRYYHASATSGGTTENPVTVSFTVTVNIEDSISGSTATASLTAKRNKFTQVY